jgi:hypothetical protein
MILRTKRARFVYGTMAVALMAITQPAWAQVGEPMGAGALNTFGIKITHGATTIINNPSVVFPADIKLNDGDEEDYVVVGTDIDTEFILKVVSDGAASEDFRTTHWYIDSIAPGDIHTPGAVSLFDPANTSAIEVEISNIKFAGTLTATPLLVDNDTYYTSFMRNEPGHFYNSPSAGTFNQNGMGVIDIQVRGESYLDATPSQYTFSATSGGVVSWAWRDIVAPGTTTTVTDEFGVEKTSDIGGTTLGFVHELGLGVAFVGTPIPEPATLSMLVLTPLIFRRRRTTR